MGVRRGSNLGAEPGVLLGGVAPGEFEMMFAERQGADAETNQVLTEMHDVTVAGPALLR
jgi:hypothetical protein